MNRKGRRAAFKRDKRPAVPAQGSVDQLAAEARGLFDEGQFAQAQIICREVLTRAPAHVDCLNLTGLIAQSSARHTAAIRSFEKAIAADPYNAACHYNIGLSFQAMNDDTKTAAHFREAIALGLSGKDIGEFIVQNPAIAACLERIAAMWPARPTIETLFGTDGTAALAGDVFLRCALETTRLYGVSLETLLTELRYALLGVAVRAAPGFSGVDDATASLCASLAQQCFLGEYVYAQGEDEARQAAALRGVLQERLAAESEVPALLLAIVAAYEPLHALANADTLVDMTWPEAFDRLLRQQVRAPREEARDHEAIPAITPIGDGVSAEVRQQYEENPYPRWTVIPDPAPPEDSGAAPADILVAGCGTGHHSIATARMYPGANVLAVDISLASLAYARRKTREAGLRNIEYAQADILHLGSIGRRFDRIEASGVLHHLADPKAGWRVLLSLLRPGGTMVVGLYSATARRSINTARSFAAERGYRATAQDIRACRAELIRREADMLRKDVTSLGDFYAMSECRDLLFNVMEHQFTIPAIKAFLAEEGLTFLGFDIDGRIRARFQEQFPDASALTDLDCWETFEAANPQTFINMYVFYVRAK
ncbi:MAG: methyltransferase domain-containing protein [Xanthobacteraceae bacterium]